MLMTLGPIKFEVYPFNATEYGHDHEATFVEKPVLGARPPLEWVGEGSESWSIKARIFPHRFGGLGDLKKLYQARAAGRPLYLMRGDGAQMGWVVIDKVSERSSYLDAEGTRHPRSDQVVVIPDVKARGVHGDGGGHQHHHNTPAGADFAARIDQPSITRRFDAIEGKIDKLYDFLLERLTKLPP